ncbi:MAG: MMPL family transporter, partial [Desulfatitalea sp.]|nr:MMPL family transporter [Desulfatitalea sp.]
MEKNEKISALDRLCWFLSRNTKSILLIILIITGIFLYGAFKIRGEVNLMELFPYDHPYLKLHFKYAQVFGSGASSVVIGLKSKDGDIFNPQFLGKLQKMTNEVELWDEVYRVLTVSIASRASKVVKAQAKGQIAVESLMWPELPKNDQEMALLKKHIFSNSSYNGILVSADGTAAVLWTEFRENISYAHAFNILQALREKYSDDRTSVHIIGVPMLMGWFFSLKGQIITVFAISIIGMVLVLMLIYHGNFLGMFVVMGDALILTVWGLGFIGFTGINFNPMLYVIAFLVGARMVGNAHQIT